MTKSLFPSFLLFPSNNDERGLIKSNVVEDYSLHAFNSVEKRALSGNFWVDVTSGSYLGDKTLLYRDNGFLGFCISLSYKVI